jgi:hypothetical protein
MGLTMSKKKRIDRHLSGRMVRMPAEWHEALKALAAQNRRPLTWELLLAIEEHLRHHGIEPPPPPRAG